MNEGEATKPEHPMMGDKTYEKCYLICQCIRCFFLDRMTELETALANYKGAFDMMEAHPEHAHTFFWDEHPEDHDDPCLCVTCRSYMGGR